MQANIHQQKFEEESKTCLLKLDEIKDRHVVLTKILERHI